jgi:glutamate decarboxylase
MFEYATDGDDQVTSGLARHFSHPQPEFAGAADLRANFMDSRIPDRPASLDSYIRYLLEDVVPHSVRTHDSRFVGHMTSPLPNFVHAVGRIMTALNQNVVKLETSNALTFQERQALGILHRLVYGCDQDFYDLHIQRAESTLGMVASGGTLANITAMWCARNARLGPRDGFPGVFQAGLSEALRACGYRRAVIVGSSLMHYSLEKAVDLLGIGRQSLIRVPAREDGSIDPGQLECTLRRCAAEGDLVLSLVGIAGTTETGAVDPLSAMADLAADYDCHFHVDAAWGGPVLFSEKYRNRLRGIERADSVAIDGHKQLCLPMGIGTVLFRDPSIARSVETAANYIIRTGSFDLGRRTIEGSRPAMAMYLHAALHVIGHNGYRALVEDGIEKAADFACEIDARAEFELLAEPHLNIVVYRFVPQALRQALRAGRIDGAANAAIDSLNRTLQDIQRDRGSSFVSRTILTNTKYGPASPVVSLRAVLANPLTTRTDLTEILDEQVSLGEQLSAALDRDVRRADSPNEALVEAGVQARITR